MNLSKAFLNFAFLTSASISQVASQPPCQTVVTPLSDEEFNPATYLTGKWYAIQQRTNPFFQGVGIERCTTASYSALDPTSAEQAAAIANGHEINVFNTLKDSDGTGFTSDDDVAFGGVVFFEGGLCASQVGLKSQLLVTQCTTSVSGQATSYIVVAYDEEAGYALIAGGMQAQVPTSEPGLCTYGSPAAGLWILARSPDRNEAMIEKYRGIAAANGLSPTIMLKDVSQVGCDHTTNDAPNTKSPKGHKKNKAPKASKTPKAPKKSKSPK